MTAKNSGFIGMAKSVGVWFRRSSKYLRHACLLALLGCGVAHAEQPPAGEGPRRGEALFAQKCGLCHFAGKTGAQMLERRLGKERSLLAERQDLVAPYIRTVVRHGLAGMPPLTRVELPDAELDAIAAYLTRAANASNEQNE